MFSLGWGILACLIAALPGPPGVRIDDFYVTLYPVWRMSCPTIDVRRDIIYTLFTLLNPIEGQVIEVGNDALLNKSNIDFANPTVIYLHGFCESDTAPSSIAIRSAYMQRPENYNVIIMDAKRLIAGPWYQVAVKNTEIVGHHTAKLIDYFVTRGLQLNQLHVIGLSLGAQMAGIAGHYVTNGKIGRITGLDPTGPLFQFMPSSSRLDRKDAQFVDVIHTDAGIFGDKQSIGHVDFWPNGGFSPQPGCSLSEIRSSDKESGFLKKVSCSHWRAYEFFAESVVNPNSFISISCPTWNIFTSGECEREKRVPLGFTLPKTARGNFFLTTNPEQPYSRELKTRFIATRPVRRMYKYHMMD